MTEAKFTTGPIIHHIFVMTSTASIGLMALFLVDFADIYFLSLLDDIAVTSAVGFGGTILFFPASVSIGLMIAMGALVSKAVGARKSKRAKQLSMNVFVYSLIVTAVVALLIWFSIPVLLTLLGAEGRAHGLASGYLRIVIASMPVVGLAIVSAGLLRALGDAKRSMILTLSGAAVNGILDPILIFGFELGIEGAAIATVISRLVMLAMALHAIIIVHKIVAPFSLRLFRSHLASISAIAVPAVLTNIATPIGSAYVIYGMSEFGNSAVAGMSIITKLMHVVFGVVFALSGVVGPIIGQNLGARKFDRIRKTFRDSIAFSFVFVLVVSFVLYLVADQIVAAFHMTDEAARLITLYCKYLAVTFVFAGGLFVANAGFNNLGRPTWSTGMNFGRATLGTIPFVYFGGKWFGAEGVLMGHTLGGIIFGVIAIIVALRLVEKLAQDAEDHPSSRLPGPCNPAASNTGEGSN